MSQQDKLGGEAVSLRWVLSFPSRHTFQNCKLKVKLMTAKQRIVGGWGGGQKSVFNDSSYSRESEIKSKFLKLFVCETSVGESYQ